MGIWSSFDGALTKYKRYEEQKRPIFVRQILFPRTKTIQASGLQELQKMSEHISLRAVSHSMNLKIYVRFLLFPGQQSNSHSNYLLPSLTIPALALYHLSIATPRMPLGS